ncbi:MAG: hypothetical protein AAGH40_12930 [Verrucomicrobiota bacterium]
MGDLNTMGMNYKYSKYDIPQKEEIERLDRYCDVRGLIRLSKNHQETYGSFNRATPLISDLDHVVASDHLSFEPLGGADVEVVGWVDQNTLAQKKKWTKQYSDHCMLYFEISN